MNAITTVFQNAELRGLILSIKTHQDKMNYIKRIYSSWKVQDGIKTIDTLPMRNMGKTHISNTINTTWSIAPRKTLTVDTAPLIVTDNVDEDGRIVYYDDLVNFTEINTRTLDWYIHPFEYVNYDPFTLRDYFTDLCQYQTNVGYDRDDMLDLELNYRKAKNQVKN